jgi:hypothetical protein
MLLQPAAGLAAVQRCCHATVPCKLCVSCVLPRKQMSLLASSSCRVTAEPGPTCLPSVTVLHYMRPAYPPLPLQGYKVLPPPAGYQPIYTPARKLMATPTPGMFGGVPGTPMYSIPTESDGLKQVYGGAEMPEGLPELKPEDQAVSSGGPAGVGLVGAIDNRCCFGRDGPVDDSGAGKSSLLILKACNRADDSRHTACMCTSCIWRTAYSPPQPT